MRTAILTLKRKRKQGPWSLVAAAIALLLLVGAHADTPNSPNNTPHNTPNNTHSYAIEKQPIAIALTRFAEASNLQLLFFPQNIPDLQIGPLVGNYTPEQALNLLLKNTNLYYAFGGNHAVVIRAQTEEELKAQEGKASPPKLSTQAATQPPGKSENEPEEISITGIRNSIWRSLAFKHQATATLDVMTSEDVGKFPDKNAADSLQRLPGVSVDRIWGEARDINIRGTDKDINRTLMNGQSVASAYWWANDNPGRGFNYTILASELISSLVLYKSPEADIDEGSIGGTVIIYTHKPFEMESKTFRATLEEQYADLANQFAPQVSMLGSWKNADETFGALASMNWQNRSMRRDGLETYPDNTHYSITDNKGNTTNNVYVIWGGGSAIFQQQSERLTNNLTLQWVPAEGWQTVFNYVESASTINNSNQNYLFRPSAYNLQQAPTTTVIDPRYGATGDGNQILLGGIMDDPNAPGAALDAIFRQSYLDSAVYDLDTTYQQDNWQLHVQAGATNAQGGSNHDRLYRFVGNTREQFSLSRNSIEVQYLDLNPEDPNSLPQFSADSHDWIRKMADHETYAQIDSQWNVDNHFFTSVKTGYKWRDQVISNRRQVGTIDTENPSWSQLQQIGLEDVSASLTPRLDQKIATANSLTQFAWVDKHLLDQVIEPRLDSGLLVYSDDPQAYYRINEIVGAGYLKGNFQQGPVHGDIGVRIANTQQASAAYQDATLKSQFRSYWDVLPNINLTYDLRDDLLWRASLSSVMARPTFQNLSANIVIDGTNGTASSGNPNLQPSRANQLDCGFEWYFDKAAILSATYFYKAISTFIYTTTKQELVDGVNLDVTRPYNAEGATISGMELQWQQDLGYGFGWLSNYTFTFATVPSPDGQRALKLPGNSRDQFNASLYYEKSGYDIRLSFNYRSESFGELISGSQDETNAYRQWDLTASHKINPNISLYVEGVNLTNEVIYYRTANDVPQGLYELGRRFSVGARLTF